MSTGVEENHKWVTMGHKGTNNDRTNEVISGWLFGDFSKISYAIHSRGVVILKAV